MSIFSKIFPSKEIKIVIEALNEAEKVLDNSSFHIVRIPLKKAIYKKFKKVSEIIRNGTSENEWIYSMICNISGNYVESGHYHLHRGILNPMGHGKNLLKLFDNSTDELVKLGAIEKKYAQEQKKGVRENMKNVG